MRPYTLPSGKQIDLDQVLSVSPIFINKNYSQYNCYEIYYTNGQSDGVFENDLARATFMAAWSV